MLTKLNKLVSLSQTTHAYKSSVSLIDFKSASAKFSIRKFTSGNKNDAEEVQASPNADAEEVVASKQQDSDPLDMSVIDEFIGVKPDRGDTRKQRQNSNQGNQGDYFQKQRNADRMEEQKFYETNKKNINSYGELEGMAPQIDDPALERAHLFEKLSNNPEYDPFRAVNMQPPTAEERVKLMGEIDNKLSETMKRMKMYDQSSEILDLIKQRLASNKDSQMQGYLESKLGQNKKPYSQFLTEQLQNSQNKNPFGEMSRAEKTEKPGSKISLEGQAALKHKEEYLVYAGAINANERQEEARATYDSFKSGDGQTRFGHQNAFVASNQDDSFNYQRKKAHNNQKEYAAYIKEIEEQEIIPTLVESQQKEFDRKMHILDLKDKRAKKPSLKPDSEEYNLRVRRVLNGEGQNPDLEEYLFPGEVDYDNETGADKWKRRMSQEQFIYPIELAETATTHRELVGDKLADEYCIEENLVVEYKKQAYSKEPDTKNNLHYDKVTLDGPRDFEGEMIERRRQGIVYDERAASATQANMDQPRTHTSGFTEADFETKRPHQQYIRPEEQERLSEHPEYQTSNDDLNKYQRDVLFDHHSDNFDQVKILEFMNKQSRKRLSSSLISLKSKLVNVVKQRDQIEDEIVRHHNQAVEQQTLPNQKKFDIIEHEREISTKLKEDAIRQEIAELTVLRDEKFDPSSREVDQYERQLKVLSLLGLLLDKSKRADLVNQFDYVLACMQENKITQTPQIKARIFEYSLLNGQLSVANDMLAKLSSDFTDAFSPVDTRYLEKFFSDSLNSDNFDGIAYLANYANRYNVDVGSYPLHKFRSALDYYLNKNFNLSKVMIFVKFYQKHYADRSSRELAAFQRGGEDLTDEEAFAVSKNVFGKNEDLVDINSLSQYLVKSLGQQQIVDPLTKEDSIWSMIDFFTGGKEFVQISALNENNHISGQVIAEYIGNQLDNPQSFDRLFRVALRLDNTKLSEDFFAEVMGQLRSYQQKTKGELPRNFTDKAVKDFYLKLRASKVEMSPAMSELLLYVLSEKEMDYEVIDFCEHKKQQGLQSDVYQYFLSESLLKLQLNYDDGTYLEALEGSEMFNQASDDISACQLTQKTKAIFLDKGTQEAINYFKQQIAAREERFQSRQDLLVTLYDQFEPQDSTGPMTEEQFEEKYFESQHMAARVAKEVYLARKMEIILKDKNYDDIDNIFKLFTVMKQERDIAGEAYMLDERNHTINTIQQSKRLSKEQQEQLQAIRSRKLDLMSQVTNEDRKQLVDITTMMKEEKFELIGKLNPATISQMTNMFKDMTERDLDAVLKKKDEEDKVDEKKATFEEFHKIKDYMFAAMYSKHSYNQKHSKEKENQWYKDFDQKRIAQRLKLHKVDDRAEIPDFHDADMDRDELIEYKQSLLRGANPTEDPTDPYSMLFWAHESTLLEMRTRLSKAVVERKAEVLPLAVNIFNKVQDTHFKTLKLDDYMQEVGESDPAAKSIPYRIDDINESIQKLDLLINGNSSPILSYIKQTSHNVTGRLPSTIEEYEELIPGSLNDHPIDVSIYMRESTKLEALEKEVSKMDTAIQKITGKLTQAGKNIQNRSFKNEYKTQNKSQKADKNTQVQTRVKALYEEYLEAVKEGGSDNFEVSKERKIALMRDTLSIELGGEFVNTEYGKSASTFPTFYALDLVKFGLQRDLPGAIRLGELLLAENCEGDPQATMPVELQKSVKQYLLENNSKYHDAMKQTGPINSSIIYHQANQRNPDEVPAFVCYDDPYWQEFKKKNYKRDDNWRFPSVLAWDHKPHGIIGEIIDIESMRKKFKQQFKE